MTLARGPQILLDGAAALAARGGAGRTMRENIAAKQALEAAGVVGDGNSVDGRSITGIDPEDYFLGSPQQITLPIGTTAERPSTGDIGQLRYNSTTGQYECGVGGAWYNILAGAGLLGLGTDPGEVPIFGNFQGSGLASLGFPSRFIVYRSAASTATDYGTMEVRRDVTHTGGVGNAINGALRVSTSVGADVTSQEWGIISQTFSNNTHGGVAVGGDFQGIRNVGSNATIWGGIMDARDETGTASSVGIHAVVGAEIDVQAGNIDDGTNPQSWGFTGLRKGIQVAIFRRNFTVDLEVSHGLWFSVNEKTVSRYGSAIGTQLGTQMYSFLDTRGAVAPNGYSGPVAGVRLETDQVIDFNGGALLSSAAGNYLQYRAATGRLYYVVAGVDKFSIDASGNVRAAGTLTGSTTP